VAAGTGTTSIINSNTSGSTGVTLEVAGTGIAISESGNTITLTGSALTAEVDGSITNEGSLTVGAGTATTSIINSNTSGSTGVTIEVAGTGLSISESGNTITLTGSGGGGITGSGTTSTIPVWSGATALGDSPLAVASGNVTATGTGAFRLPNGTNAQRPGTPTAGMSRYNTTNGALEYYISGWEVPMRGAPLLVSGVGYANGVFFADANGKVLNDLNTFNWDNTNKRLGIGTGSPLKALDVTTTANFRDGIAVGDYQNTTPPLNGLIVSGNVGIGTDSPISAYQATFFGSTFCYFSLNTTASGMTSTDGFQFGLEATGDANFVLREAGAIGLWTNNSQRMTISSAGSVGIANTSPQRTLHVTGEVRITDLTTDNPTRIVGADADGDLGALKLGTNLSISGDTLNATAGAGVTDLAFSGSASPVTLTSSTGTDVIFAAGSGVALSQSTGTMTISRTYSLTHITISGGSTFFGTTPERPDNDTPGSATTSAVGSDFSVSGSTLDYTGPGGALLRVQGTVSFSVADDGDYYLSFFKEGTEIAATSTRVTCVAGNYYTITLPATTTAGATNDTFDVRIATVTGNSTCTLHRHGFIVERVY
jgi:hypothetical protein